jgi:hypothetical protein
MAEDHSKSPQLAPPSIRLSRSKEYRTIYSNTFRAKMGSTEIGVVFGYQTEIPGVGDNVIIDEAEIVMTTTTLKVLYLALRDFVEVIENAAGQPLVVSQGIVDALTQTKQKMIRDLEEAKRNPQIQPVTPT